MNGLFLNNKKAKDSIFESGQMVYQCLSLSNRFTLDYIEVDIDNRSIPGGYDFYFFNYHPVTMNWLDTSALRKQLGFCITMVLEVAPNDPFVYCSSTDFDAYCVLDPTVKSKSKKVFAFPRPLEKIDFALPVVENEIPVIGSFGFATKGKGFQHVVEAVNKEFERAVIKINIPYGDFVPDSKEYAFFLSNLCKQRAKDGIEVSVTHDFMDKADLIKWCASNTLNCFLYDRNVPGLAATTDQAIVSGRPLSVSDNDTFRHITQYLRPYPAMSLKDSVTKSIPIIKKIQEAWSPENFARKFEEVLEANKQSFSGKARSTAASYELPIKQKSVLDLIQRRYKKYKRKLGKLNFGILSGYHDSKRKKEVI